MKTLQCSYEWAKIPTDLDRHNLVLVTAKTPKTTIHPEDPEYSIRIFKPEELREAARSLAQRPVGLNHGPIIVGAFTVDANWNEKEQAVEALLYVPEPYISRIRTGEINKVSVEFTWRDEKKTDKGVEFEGFVFNRVDLLSGMNPGDSNTRLQLVEGKRGLMEGIIQQDNIQASVDKPSESFFKDEEVEGIFKTLGEPLHADFKEIYNKMIDKYGPEKGKQVYYAWLNKHGYDDTKAFPKKEGLKEEKFEPPEAGDLPEHGKEILSKAYAACRTQYPDYSKERCSKIAWGAVHNAGYVKEDDKWVKKEAEPQIPEQPISSMASEPAPMTPSPLPQQVEPVQVTSVGAVSDSKGPLGREPEPVNPDKNLNMPPATASPGPHDSEKEGDSMIGDKDKVKVGEQPQVGIGTPLVESASNKPKEEPKKEEPKKEEPKIEPKSEPKPVDKPIESKPAESVPPPVPSTSTPTPLPVKPAESPKPDDKENRIKELEGVVTKLQENVKKLEADRNKAIKEAVEKTKKELIDKIKEALPSENIISNFNRGGRILATDIKKVVYEAEATKE